MITTFGIAYSILRPPYIILVINVIYNRGHNKWYIWTTPTPISMMPKWRVLLFRAFIIALGGRGLIVPFYSIQDCRLRVTVFPSILLENTGRRELTSQRRKLHQKGHGLQFPSLIFFNKQFEERICTLVNL